MRITWLGAPLAVFLLVPANRAARAAVDVSATNDLSRTTGVECRWQQRVTMGAHVYFSHDPSFSLSLGYRF